MTEPFRIYPKRYDGIVYIYSEKDEIWTDPPYQRMSDIWPVEKRQLLIDSILNGFDIPKLYFHELIPPKKDGKRRFKYAIIDGKQRLESIWGFIDGEYDLSPDFEYLSDPKVQAGGLSYEDLARRYPRLKSQFDATNLPVILVEADDTELIEEMFSRLNEAVPLNAAEKRNARGGPMPKVIRSVSRTPFISKRLPFTNRRYRHYDLATKFLYIEDEGGIVDTKKVYLDAFVVNFRDRTDADARGLREKVKRVLGSMSRVFHDGDSLLNSVGMAVLYYLLFRDARASGQVRTIKREKLENFNKRRARNREIAEEDISEADYELLEFDRLTQTPNDAFAIEYRYNILRKRLKIRAPK